MGITDLLIFLNCMHKSLLTNIFLVISITIRTFIPTIKTNFHVDNKF